MVQVAKLSADLTANTSNFDANLKKSSNLLGQLKRAWSKDLKDIDGNFGALGKGISGDLGKAIAGLTAGASLVGLAVLAKKAVDLGSAIDDTAQRLQIGTSELQRFQFGAKLSGIEAETFEAAITKLNSNIADGEFNYKNATEGLNSIAEAVKNAKTDTDRLAIANDAFGAKLGAKMLPLLTGGAEGLRKFGDEADRTGNVLSKSTIKAAAQFGDTLDIITGTLEKNFNQGFLDSFVGSSDELRAVYSDPKFAEGIKNVGQLVGDLTNFILQSISALGQFIGKYNDLDKKVKDKANGYYDQFIDYGSRKFDSPENRAKYLQDKANKAAVGGEVQGPPLPVERTSEYIASKATRAKADADKKAANAAMQRAQSYKDILAGFDQENDKLKAQTDLYGQQEGAIARATKELDINAQFKKAGIVLTDKQQAQLQIQLDQYEQLTDKQKAQTDATKAQEDADRDRAQAFAQLGATFSSAFEDAVLNGDKLSDVLNGLLRDIAKLVLRTQVLQPLMDSLFGKSGSGGLLSSVGGSIFSSIGSALGFSSHAQGLDYVPRDMMVKVHRGEEIVSARDVNARNRSGGDVTVNITNNSNASVSSKQSQSGNGVQLDVLVDQAVAKNLAKPGSQTSQALAAQKNRTLVRR